MRDSVRKQIASQLDIFPELKKLAEEKTKGVGDVTSSEKGSGARYNTGKPDYSLLPLSTLEDEVRVWMYGKEKYSARGDCTCAAGNVVRKRYGYGAGDASSAATYMRKSCESETQSSQRDSEKTAADGTSATRSTQYNWSESAMPDGEQTQTSKSSGESLGLRTGTDSHWNSTQRSDPADALFAGQPKESFMSTTTTQRGKLEGCCAIPATLALDLSNGLKSGLEKHSPTCGVRQIKASGSWNWAKGMAWSVPFACLMRHLAAWQRGEEVDAESGLPHLAHAMCNLRMLTLFSKTYKEGDDRPPKEFVNAP